MNYGRLNLKFICQTKLTSMTKTHIFCWILELFLGNLNVIYLASIVVPKQVSFLRILWSPAKPNKLCSEISKYAKNKFCQLKNKLWNLVRLAALYCIATPVLSHKRNAGHSLASHILVTCNWICCLLLYSFMERLFIATFVKDLFRLNTGFPIIQRKKLYYESSIKNSPLQMYSN